MSPDGFYVLEEPNGAECLSTGGHSTSDELNAHLIGVGRDGHLTSLLIEAINYTLKTKDFYLSLDRRDIYSHCNPNPSLGSRPVIRPTPTRNPMPISVQVLV
jgi:hypothetical protein